MTYQSASKQCKRTGTAHATGDSLRAMYAALVAQIHGGEAAKYYAWLQAHATGDDNNITETSRCLLRDRAMAWDVLMGNGKWP